MISRVLVAFARAIIRMFRRASVPADPVALALRGSFVSEVGTDATGSPVIVFDTGLRLRISRYAGSPVTRFEVVDDGVVEIDHLAGVHIEADEGTYGH